MKLATAESIWLCGLQVYTSWTFQEFGRTLRKENTKHEQDASGTGLAASYLAAAITQNSGPVPSSETG
jgi:hypothetical protein